MPKATGRSHVSRACDACRRRRVRCLVSTESATSCKQCLDRSDTCTYDIPHNRRGPPRARLSAVASTNTPGDVHEQDPVQHENILTPHSEPRNNGLEPLTDAPPASHASLSDDIPSRRSTESRRAGISPSPRPRLEPMVVSLCSEQLMDTAIRDYLHHLYPLLPVIHIPSFLQHLDSGRHTTDVPFLCLLLSFFTLVCSMLPRRFEHYRALDPEFGNEFTHRRQVLDRVQSLIHKIQGPDYFDDLTLVKWASAYCRMSACAYLGLVSRAMILRSEAETMLFQLNCHRVVSYTGLNEIEAQLRKKAFWMMVTARLHKDIYELAWDRHSDLVALRDSDIDFLIPHDVDDEFITENAVSNQSTDLPSLAAGFNAEKSLLRYLITSRRAEAPRSSANNTSRTRSEVLSQDLAYLLDDMPAPLELWQINHTEITQSPLRSLQWSIQRANIHTTHLWIRALFLNQEAEHVHSTNTHATIEDICRQLLHLLSTSSLASLEPNGHVLVMKIRQIAASLAGNDFDDHRSEQVKNRAKIYLQKFAALLAELDHNYTDDLQLDSSSLLLSRSVPVP